MWLDDFSVSTNTDTDLKDLDKMFGSVRRFDWVKLTTHPDKIKNKVIDYLKKKNLSLVSYDYIAQEHPFSYYLSVAYKENEDDYSGKFTNPENESKLTLASFMNISAKYLKFERSIYILSRELSGVIPESFFEVIKNRNKYDNVYFKGYLDGEFYVVVKYDRLKQLDIEYAKALLMMLSSFKIRSFDIATNGQAQLIYDMDRETENTIRVFLEKEEKEND